VTTSDDNAARERQAFMRALGIRSERLSRAVAVAGAAIEGERAKPAKANYGARYKARRASAAARPHEPSDA
jgi:hypothetical protein